MKSIVSGTTSPSSVVTKPPRPRHEQQVESGRPTSSAEADRRHPAAARCSRRDALPRQRRSSPAMIASITAATSHFCQPELLSSPRPTQMRVEHAGLGLVTFLVWYMNRQMTRRRRTRSPSAGRSATWRRSRPWPGRPARRRQGRTPWPGAVTTMTHHMLLTSVPRNVASTAHAARKKPTSIGR